MKKQTHFLGIGGIGMSALVHILLEKGENISGHDQNMSAVVESLEKKGAVISEVWDPRAEIVYSSAIQPEHPNLLKARKMGCPIYHRSQYLGMLMEGKEKLLVTGTHGKTSTSALLTWVLLSAGLDPSYAIGGILKNTNQNGGYGKGKTFVAEADESDSSFLNYEGDYAIMTNLEKEHLDFWETEEKLTTGFKTFAKSVKNLFWCIDDPMLSNCKFSGETYGRSEKADWQLLHVKQQGMKLAFSISHQGKVFEKVELPLIGEHQALNACAVWALAFRLGVSEIKVRKAFSTFKGARRRLEKKGEASGVTIYDDYAHHPTEVMLTLASLKKAIGNRPLIAIFQPHRYTRTRDCLEGFARAFDTADRVYITKIYPAGEKPIKGITGKALCERIPGSILLRNLPVFQSGDVVVTIGAGDITHLGSLILEKLE